MVGNGTELRVLNLDFADTGAYMCQAESVGGITRAISSLVVLAVPPPSTIRFVEKGNLIDSSVFYYYF